MPIIAAGAAIGGTLLSGAFGRKSASKSMAFQREMAQKGHQYEVADLRKAGLNPILSATGGPGAKASGGAMPQTPDYGGAVQTALKVKAEVDNIQAQTKLTDAKTGLIKPASGIGTDLSDFYKWMKGKAVSTSKDLQKWMNEYEKSKSNITQTPGSRTHIKIKPSHESWKTHPRHKSSPYRPKY